MDVEKVSKLLVAPDKMFNDILHPGFADKMGQGPAAAAGADAVIVGAPSDTGTYRHFGTNLGPMGVRKALANFRSYSVELDLDIYDYLKVADIGNTAVTNWNSYDEVYGELETVVAEISRANKVPIIIGGDHGLSAPAAKGFARGLGKKVGIVWFDDHFDAMDQLFGDPKYCGCPIYEIVKEEPRLFKGENVAHVGLHGFGNSAEAARLAREVGIKIITMDEIRLNGIDVAIRKSLEIASKGTDAIYVSVDIDAADVVYAPGTQAPRPGGMTSWELLYFVRKVALAGATGFDVMEVAPPRDVSDATSMLAAELILQFLGGVAARKRG